MPVKKVVKKPTATGAKKSKAAKATVKPITLAKEKTKLSKSPSLKKRAKLSAAKAKAPASKLNPKPLKLKNL